LRPDLVILDASQARSANGLSDAGIRTLVLTVHNLADVRRSLLEIGTLLGTQAESSRVVTAIEQAERDARTRATQRPPPRPRVFFAIDRELGGLRNLVAAGPGTFVDDLFDIVGADNATRAFHARYPKLSPEEVVRAAPDIILDAVHEAGKHLSDWRVVNVPAVRYGRVHAIDNDAFIAPGPRLPEALAELEKLLTPSAQ
jgi:iron complex transport system substrate-binding protein